MKKIVTTLFFLVCTVIAFAQNEVTLVISADGISKTEAINNALRSAIEQTFGTFVSANTQILNDELVKDEIATVSSGNIQKYKELAVVNLPNGNTSVTLNVTVSLKKLVKYAKSKGSECEFAGATFGANARLYEFNKRNEKIVIQNMINQLDALRPAFDYEIEVSDPVMNKDERTAKIIVEVKAKANKNTKQFNNIIISTFMSMALTEDEAKPMLDAGFKLFPCQIMIGERDKLFTFRGNIDKYSYSEYHTYFLYNKIPEEITTFVTEALYDFSITDNAGGIYNNHIHLQKHDDFGYIVGNNTDSYYREFIPITYASRGDYLFNKGPHVKDMKIIVYTDKIQGIMPKFVYNIPVEHLNKMKKIEIMPNRGATSNIIVRNQQDNKIETSFIQPQE